MCVNDVLDRVLEGLFFSGGIGLCVPVGFASCPFGLLAIPLYVLLQITDFRDVFLSHSVMVFGAGFVWRGAVAKSRRLVLVNTDFIDQMPDLLVFLGSGLI